MNARACAFEFAILLAGLVYMVAKEGFHELGAGLWVFGFSFCPRARSTHYATANKLNNCRTTIV